jgi:aminopeptidase
VIDGVVGDYLCAKYGICASDAAHDQDRRATARQLLKRQRELRIRVLAYTHTDENSDRVGEFAIGTNIGLSA